MSNAKPARLGQVIGLKPELYDRYVEDHENVWPGVLRTIHDCGIRNYSIFHMDNMLFSYFEYVGDDFEADMQKMADDPVTQEWWAIMKPMQEPMPTRRVGEWWARMTEVFHVD